MTFEQVVSGIGMTSQRTRDRMIERIKTQGVLREDVLEVMRFMPRHLFVDEALSSRAYEDTALPIGFRQTISQPYIVAKMTELLLGDGEKPKKVLEIGSGSGYQAAVLSQLVDQVYTVERIEGLHEKASKRFKKFKLDNIRCLYSDGGWGWPEFGPYDAIMLTAAPEDLPEELIPQLVIGGRIVAPVGTQDGQVLRVYVKTNETQVEQTDLEPVSFVPFLNGVS